MRKKADGFNGGGDGYTGTEYTPTYYCGSGGGGATDIRISGGEWNNTNGLNSRIIVAGGGGGTTNGGSTKGRNAGVGGGIQGGNTKLSYTYSSECSLATGGTQTSGGKGGGFGTGMNYTLVPGSFGKGANTPLNSVKASSSGAGGGWYGGGAGNWGPSGGGSGWIYTEEFLNTWKTGNPTDAANWQLDSKYYLTEAQTIAGDQTFKSPTGEDETGHSGDGYARITWIGN